MAVTNQKTVNVNKLISIAGDSIWANITGPVDVSKIKYEFGYDWDTEGEYADSINVWVEHNNPWEIYTDTDFPKIISKLIGHDVDWSEQGLQENGLAHLEA